MIIRHSTVNDIPILKSLWREAFNDSDSFIDNFFNCAYKENRSLILESDNKIASMLYWFDCTFNEKPVAYIYAVATFNEFQKKGLCNALMEALHKHLKALGYIGACLVPSNEHLFNFYGKMGYIKCMYNNEKEVLPEKGIVDFIKISAEEYINLRKNYLPKNCITQNNISFLKLQANFFKGDNFLLCARKEKDTLFVLEFWGNKNKQGNIVYCQNAKKGLFRTTGAEKPFAMYLPFEETLLPEYLDFAYD